MGRLGELRLADREEAAVSVEALIVIVWGVLLAVLGIGGLWWLDRRWRRRG